MPEKQTAKHRCNECLKDFSRREHLQRHQLIHYSVRSYSCALCSQRFARSDALQRHEKAHGTSSSTGLDVTRSRRHERARTIAACDRCARMKVKCDGKSPCGRCKKQMSPCTLQREHMAFKRLQNDATTIQRIIPTIADNTPSPEASSNVSASFNDSPAPPADCTDVCTVEPGTADGAESFGLNGGVFAMTNEGQGTLRHSGGLGSIWESPGIVNYGAIWDDVPLLFDAQGGPGLFLDGSYQADPINIPQKDPAHANPQDQVQSSDLVNEDRQRYYDKYPQLYKPDAKGNPLRTSVICEFLQSSDAWAKIDNFSMSLNQTHLTKIKEGVRDSVMATVHIVLAKVLDKEQMGKIPTTFPPLRVVDTIFNVYLSRFSLFYPIANTNMINYDHTLHYNGSGVQLQLLSIFASGALLIPVPEIQTFAIDLASIILQVLYEIFLRDASQTRDIYLTSTAILITAFGIWSGNKREMELAEALRSSYTTMMSRRGMHERAQNRTQVFVLSNAESEWKDWLMKEKRRRLAYAWYVVEQEISFFNGVPTTLSFTELRCPMPSSESMFSATTSEDWKNDILQRQNGDVMSSMFTDVVELRCPHSLAAFHRLFLRGNGFQNQDVVTPLQIRLLLCTIQTLVSQYSQTKRFVPEEEDFSPGVCAISASAEYTQLRSEELHYLLVKWHLLYRSVMPHTIPVVDGTDLSCVLMAHLIAMELAVPFDDVQLFAGKEGFVEGKMLMSSFRRWAKTSIASRGILHAGQIYRTLMTVGEGTPRPLWWPLAVARSALLLWAYAMATQENLEDVGRDIGTPPVFSITGHIGLPGRSQGVYFLDGAFEESAMFSGVVLGYLEQGKVPCLTGPEGSVVPIMQTSEVLDLSISILRDGEAASTPLCRCVQTFLQDIQDLGVAYPGADESSIVMQTP